MTNKTKTMIDKEKRKDFRILSREDFLDCYYYLTEAEYDEMLMDKEFCSYDPANVKRILDRNTELEIKNMNLKIDVIKLKGKWKITMFSLVFITIIFSVFLIINKII